MTGEEPKPGSGSGHSEGSADSVVQAAVATQLSIRPIRRLIATARSRFAALARPFAFIRKFRHQHTDHRRAADALSALTRLLARQVVQDFASRKRERQ
jgi:hypothetical protein